MTVSMGGITLSDHLALTIAPDLGAVTKTRLIGGAPVIQADAAQGGRTLTLTSKRCLRCSQRDQIQALQMQGLPVQLVHHRGVFTVVITDTSTLSDDFYRADPDNDATLTCSGDITMIEV